MRELRVFAPAKLNLYLDVLGKRSDGYHNIKTVFEKIDLRDEIIIRKKDRGIKIKVEPSNSICPSGKDNIVYRALQALFRETDVNLGLEIIIKKKIPVSSGLGGGSSDAATVLRAINEFFDLRVSFERLVSMAAEVGMDVPFFMLDAPFAIGKARGEVLTALETETSFFHVVIKPDVAVSTAQMYKRLDGYVSKTKKSDISRIISALETKDLGLLKDGYYNIFEEILTDYSAYIHKAKALLSGVDAGPGFLSGSGPSVFCTVKQRGEAMEILARLTKKQKDNIFLARTYKGGIYGDNRG